MKWLLFGFSWLEDPELAAEPLVSLRGEDGFSIVSATLSRFESTLCG